MSDSEFTHVIEDVQSTKIVEILPLIIGGEMLFTTNDVELMQQSSNKHEIIVRMTKTLESFCNNLKLSFVNSEEVKWLHTMKPDGFVCPQGLFRITDKHRPELDDLRKECGGEFLVGGGIWEN